MPNKVRVRLAPSPTGEVHIGTLWLALFDWIYARQNNGSFVLRIEDTDQKRLVAGSVERLYEALAWIGITPDEGPREGGTAGPYVQSERLALYRQYADALVAKGAAYHCFCSPERLTELRNTQAAAKQPPRYDKQCLNLSAAEVTARLSRGEAATIRLNLPTQGIITHHDIIRGDVSFNWSQLDDSIIMKSDGFPTYHLAVVVDDHLMKISHVFRAEEWLPSVPKHIFLYQALGWELPQFAHFPLILGTDKSKLSKRHGAVSAISYRDAGYLSAAMFNFLILMGWHPVGDNEILNMAQVIEQFKLERMNPSGAIFDQTKLDWFNGYYIRHLTTPELLSRLTNFWHRPAGESSDESWNLKALDLVKDRLVKLADIDELINYLFASEWDRQLNSFDYHLIVPKQGSAEKTKIGLTWVKGWIEKYGGEWTAVSLKIAMIKDIAAAGYKNIDVLWPVRVCLSLRAASPDVFDMMNVLGKSETIRRINTAGRE